MKRQHIKIKFSSVSTTTRDSVYPRDRGKEVSSVADITSFIREQLNTVIRRFNRDLNTYLEATIELATGEKIQVPIRTRLHATFKPELTEKSFNVMLGKEVAIKFGSSLHNTLYKANMRGGGGVLGTKNHITLESLGLVGGWGDWLTDKGKLVLEQLTELGPPNNKRGLLLVARALLRPRKMKDGPLKEHLLNHGLISPTNKTSLQGAFTAPLEITDKGNWWLEEHAIRLYKYKVPEHVLDKAEIVEHLPREHLAEPLASQSEWIRRAARKRMKELEDWEMLERLAEVEVKTKEDAANIFNELVEEPSQIGFGYESTKS